MNFTLTNAVRFALAGGVMALGASSADASVTMYNTFKTVDQNSTDGWTRSGGSSNSGSLNPWVGVVGTGLLQLAPGNIPSRPFNFRGGSALSWAIALTSAGDSGVVSAADSAKYAGQVAGFTSAEIDTAQGAWQDESAAKTGWRHQTDFGLIKSEVTQKIRINATVEDGAFPSLFGITLYQGMDNTVNGGWSHHGGWNAGYVAGDTSPANLAIVSNSNALGISGLTFLDFIDSSGVGPHGANYLEFTALAGQVYTVALGGRAGGSWNGVKASYALHVSAVPVPAAVWLLGSALAGMGVIGRRKKA